MAQQRPAWAPEGVEIERPAAARMYDYYLGGSHNFAADRELAEATIRAWPDVMHLCRANRAFLRRAVSLLAAQGIDQFLDLGSGIPTVGNVHELSHGVNPAARTVYVDSDPVAIAHSTALLAEVPHARVVQADLREPGVVLGSPVLKSFLDLSRPVAVLMLAVLPFVPDEDDPAGIAAAYRDATAPGSYLVFSHGTNEYRPEQAAKVSGVYDRASHAMALRDRPHITRMLDGYELLEPGLVDVIHWRPDPLELAADPLGGDVSRYSVLAAVGRRV